MERPLLHKIQDFVILQLPQMRELCVVTDLYCVVMLALISAAELTSYIPDGYIVCINRYLRQIFTIGN